MRRGRTRRVRQKKQINPRNSLKNDQKIINLKKYMVQNGFDKRSFDLELYNFPITGRGVLSKKSIKRNEILLEIPFDLLITFKTLLESMNITDIFHNNNNQLRIQDLLSTFLVLERHKENSSWEFYLNSLPDTLPDLPWHLTPAQVESLPIDLKSAVLDSQRMIKESFSRVQKSINTNSICSCCAKKTIVLLEINEYKWAYSLVNTRAIYVDPDIVLNNCSNVNNYRNHFSLSDDPCMALCPLLDMFNHSCNAQTEVDLTLQDGKWVFRLKTLSSYQRYQQIFISYGPHDNIKLLTEYGFFIPGNCNDSFNFSCNDILRLVEANLNSAQTKFIQTHGLDQRLFIDDSGCSFNLVAFLFVVFSSGEHVANLATAIFKNDYSGSFKTQVNSVCRKLVLKEIRQLEQCVENQKLCNRNSVLLLISDYLSYRKQWVEGLLNKMLDK